jgi:hypothetical protein
MGKPDSKKFASTRAEKNRIAARTCRARKQVYIAGLELKVAELSETLRDIGYAGESNQGIEKFAMKAVVGEETLAFMGTEFRSTLPASLNLTGDQHNFFLAASHAAELHTLALDAAVADFRRSIDAMAAVAANCRRDVHQFFAVLDERRLCVIDDLVRRYNGRGEVGQDDYAACHSSELSD